MNRLSYVASAGPGRCLASVQYFVPSPLDGGRVGTETGTAIQAEVLVG